jgi:hypothetical protein
MIKNGGGVLYAGSELKEIYKLGVYELELTKVQSERQMTHHSAR